MIQDFIDKWNKNKNKLRSVIETQQWESYKELVKIIIDNILNEGEEEEYKQYNSDEITVVDDGDYQGTQLFLFHIDTYQPNVEKYIITDTY